MDSKLAHYTPAPFTLRNLLALAPLTPLWLSPSKLGMTAWATSIGTRSKQSGPRTLLSLVSDLTPPIPLTTPVLAALPVRLSTVYSSQQAHVTHDPQIPSNVSTPISLVLWKSTLLALGAKGVIPSRQIESFLRVFKQYTHNIPSGQIVGFFKIYLPI